MNHRTALKLLAPACLLGLATAAQASAGPSRHAETPLSLLAQAAPPAPSASAPAAEAQPDNREAPARPAARRRGVGVVISMSVA